MAPLAHLKTCNKLVATLLADEPEKTIVDAVGLELQKLWQQTNDNDGTLRGLATAMHYHMDNSDGYRSLLDDLEDGQPLSEGPFGPMHETKHPENDEWSYYPPALRRIPVGTLDVWAQYAQEPVLHPALRGRLADLLWIRKHQPQHRWHKKAIAAYVEQIDQPELIDVERANAATRAVNLAKETNQTACEQSAYDAIQRFVVSQLADDDGNYGPTATCLCLLAVHGQPCDELLEQAIAKYKTDPRMHGGLLQIKAYGCKQGTDRRRHMTDAVNVLIADANSTPGIRQLDLLQDAQKLAKKEDLPTLTTELDTRIAHVDLEDEFNTTETSVNIPQEEIDEMLHSIIGDADTLRGALNAFGRQKPISGREQNQQKVRDRVDSLPFLYLTRRITIAAVGDQIAATEEPAIEHPDFMKVEVRKLEREEIEGFAVLVGIPFLRKLDAQHNPTVDELQEYFRCVWIPEDTARRIAKSYHHWRASDQDSAVSVLVLTVEAVIREMAGAMNITLTRTRDEDAGRRAGEAVTLGRLLTCIAEQPVFQNVPFIPRYLESALTARAALNLRNDLAHALASMTETQYIVLFHIVCLLRSIADHSQATDAAESPRTKLSVTCDAFSGNTLA